MIFCEFNYCVYNKKSECILETINISALGFCGDCLIPSIDDETLEKYKKELRDRISHAKINIKTVKDKLSSD